MPTPTPANPPARQNQANQPIEFIVKPKEDLYLTGQLRKLPRVSEGEAYPCQMQKNQSFSCLFRHYAKHNGLRKEDLIFSFVDELAPDQTPESCHLMPQDEVWVEHRKTPLEDEDANEQDPRKFSAQFRELFQSGVHADVVFNVGSSGEEISVHKAILSARSKYFQAMFREGAMSESVEKYIKIEPGPTAKSFKQMIEFIYANDIQNIDTFDSDELVSLLMIAEEYLMQDLKDYVERFMKKEKRISTENIGRLMLLCANNPESKLRDACSDFVRSNLDQLVSDPNFRLEVEANPDLSLLVLEFTTTAMASDAHENKRRRTSGGSDGGDEVVYPVESTISSGNNNIANTIGQLTNNA